MVTVLLGIYFRYANLNRTYGTLCGLIAFMIWLFWTSFALLVRAELNAELAKESEQGGVQPKEISPQEHERATPPAPLDRAA